MEKKTQNNKNKFKGGSGGGPLLDAYARPYGHGKTLAVGSKGFHRENRYRTHTYRWLHFVPVLGTFDIDADHFLLSFSVWVVVAQWFQCGFEAMHEARLFRPELVYECAETSLSLAM